MTFNLASDLTKLDLDELGALQVSVGLEINYTTDPFRKVLLMEHMERIDEELKSR